MTPRRQLWLAVGSCLLGAVLLLLAVGRTWVTLEDSAGITLQPLRHPVTGVTVVPGLRALGWVALAGVLALAATRRVGRLVTGTLLTGAGAVAVVLSLRYLDKGRVLDDGARAVHGCWGPHTMCRVPPGFQVHAVAHAGPVWLCLLGAVLVTAAGLLTTVRGRSWEGLGASYEAPGSAVPEPVTDKGVWDALDRGDDPTA